MSPPNCTDTVKVFYHPSLKRWMAVLITPQGQGEILCSGPSKRFVDGYVPKILAYRKQLRAEVLRLRRETEREAISAADFLKAFVAAIAEGKGDDEEKPNVVLH